MKNEFAVVNFLDECRWDSENLNNYNLINYAHNDLSNEEKLLTHWISYITDRQMPFEEVWDVGGFVFSDMVKHYRSEGEAVIEYGASNSFFTGSAFCSRLPCPSDNKLLNKRELTHGLPVKFTSRFYPSDYVSILCTLNTLEFFGRDFVEYLAAIIRIFNGQKYSPQIIVKALAYGLHLLSYEDIGQHKSDTLANTDWIALTNARTEKIKSLISHRPRFISNVEAFFKDSKYSKRYFSKRVWCSLRDYIKSPEFAPLFREKLHNKRIDDSIIAMIFSEEAQQTIELPGDVWNNKSIFRNCLFRISQTKDKNGEPFNRQLRKIFEQEHIAVGYPEQFDVTFDFVQRMCDKHLCDICPFKAVYDPSQISKICVNKPEMLCPISLVSCGYVTECKADNCSLRKLLGFNLNR